MSFYIVGSNDGRKFRVSANAVKHSEVLVKTISGYNIAPNSRIEMQQPASGLILDRIICWCEHYEHGNAPTEITDWDRNLLTFDSRIGRMNLITATSFMRIEELKKICIQLFCENETTQNTGFIELLSKEDDVFQMSVEAAQKSFLLAEILEKLSGESPVFPIPIDSNSSQLDVIVKWCEHHKGDDDSYPLDVPEFDKDLLKIGNWDLVRVMDTGVALKIHGLLRSATCIESERAITQEELSVLYKN